MPNSASVPAFPSTHPAHAVAWCAHVAFAVDDRVLHTLRVPALGTLLVGSSEENDLVLGDERFGRSHALLRREGTRWWLTLPAGVMGRARLAGHAGTLLEHVRAGRARRMGDVVELPLVVDGARPSTSAVVELSHGRLLVALEATPAVQVAPLPRVLRRDLRADVDWGFGAALSAMMVAFFFIGLAAEAADPLVDLSPPESVFAFRTVYEAPEPPAPDVPAEPTSADAETVVADATPTPAREPSRGPRTPADADGSARENEAGTPRLTREEARAQTALLLGSIGVGALRDVLAGGAAVRDGQELIDAMTDGSVATGPSAGLTAREGRDGSGRELGRLTSTTPTVATYEGLVEERRLRVRVDRPTAGPGAGNMSMNPVTQALRGRVGAIRRCYERTLNSNPGARGRLVVSFRVEGSGAFSGVVVTENGTGDPALAECVSGIIGRLRVVPAPDGGSGSFRYPFVFEPG